MPDELNKTRYGVPVAESSKEAISERDSIYESDTASTICEKMVNGFKVGDYITLGGVEAYEVKFMEDMFKFPNWMELRIRCNDNRNFVIFYPRGYLVWTLITHRSKKKVFKNLILDDMSYKIWRSE